MAETEAEEVEETGSEEAEETSDQGALKHKEI